MVGFRNGSVLGVIPKCGCPLESPGSFKIISRFHPVLQGSSLTGWGMRVANAQKGGDLGRVKRAGLDGVGQDAVCPRGGGSPSLSFSLSGRKMHCDASRQGQVSVRETMDMKRLECILIRRPNTPDPCFSAPHMHVDPLGSLLKHGF